MISKVINSIFLIFKTMEIATRFEWKSVLIDDDQFWQLQALYDVPWVYESHHLHTVKLVPLERVIRRAPYRPTARSRLGSDNRSRNFSNSVGHNVSKDPSIAVYTSDGNEIRCKFNGPMGCSLYQCKFMRVCNKSFSGKACGLNHPSYERSDP